jgi:hypothetical protein
MCVEPKAKSRNTAQFITPGITPKFRRPAGVPVGDFGRRCPVWVTSRHAATSGPCRLYPRKRTPGGHRAISALCPIGDIEWLTSRPSTMSAASHPSDTAPRSSALRSARNSVQCPSRMRGSSASEPDGRRGCNLLATECNS